MKYGEELGAIEKQQRAVKKAEVEQAAERERAISAHQPSDKQWSAYNNLRAAACSSYSASRHHIPSAETDISKNGMSKVIGELISIVNMASANEEWDEED